ncbi:hypothetical protein HIM_01681 [Hirsutella minnesotensis 3608]|nr:hypothetical protein HIM_01681 [Hirsutella minnesotensis 3608]
MSLIKGLPHGHPGGTCVGTRRCASAVTRVRRMNESNPRNGACAKSRIPVVREFVKHGKIWPAARSNLLALPRRRKTPRNVEQVPLIAFDGSRHSIAKLGHASSWRSASSLLPEAFSAIRPATSPTWSQRQASRAASVRDFVAPRKRWGKGARPSNGPASGFLAGNGNVCVQGGQAPPVPAPDKLVSCECSSYGILS